MEEEKAEIPAKQEKEPSGCLWKGSIGCGVVFLLVLVTLGVMCFVPRYKPNYDITISLPKERFEEGEPIPLLVTLTNNEPAPQNFFEMNETQATLEARIVDAKGRRWRWQGNYQAYSGVHPMPKVIHLDPGEKMTAAEDLSQMYGLVPGKYTVQCLYRTINWPIEAKKADVSYFTWFSNTIGFEILPSGEGEGEPESRHEAAE